MEHLTEQRALAASTQHASTDEHLLPCDNWRSLHCEHNLRVSYWELFCFRRICLVDVEMRVTNVYLWKVWKQSSPLLLFCSFHDEKRKDVRRLNLMMKTDCEKLRNYL